VKEILDDPPVIKPGASQGTRSENQNIDKLFKDLLKDATNKGYARQARADIQDPENTEPEDDEPEASQNSQLDDEEEEDAQVSVRSQLPNLSYCRSQPVVLYTCLIIWLLISLSTYRQKSINWSVVF